MKKDKVRMGVWTPWAQCLCFDCHTNEKLPRPKTEEEWRRITQPQDLKHINAVTFCDSCGINIQLNKSVAYEHNLVAALQERGVDAVIAQTGGMHSAASIATSDQVYGQGGPDKACDVYVTYDFDGDGKYWLGVYDDEGGIVEVDWAQQSFDTQDEVLNWVYENQEKLRKLEVQEELHEPTEERPLEDLTQEAKEKAAERNADRSDAAEPRKLPDRER